MDKFKKIIIIVFISLYVSGCNKLEEDDIRIIMPDKKPQEVMQKEKEISLTYTNEELSILDINSYIRILIDEYQYKIIEQTTMKGDDTVFALAKENGKKISFVIYQNKNVVIKYTEES